MKQKQIRVVIVEPHTPPRVETIDNTLETLQKIVGGLIQVIPNEDGLDLICNDEGKLLNLPLNRALRYNGTVYDIIAGTFLIASSEGEDFASLSDDELGATLARYKYYERFIKHDGGLIIHRSRFAI